MVLGSSQVSAQWQPQLSALNTWPAGHALGQPHVQVIGFSAWPSAQALGHEQAQVLGSWADAAPTQPVAQWQPQSPALRV